MKTKKNLAHNRSFLIFGWFQKIRKLMKIGIALTNNAFGFEEWTIRPNKMKDGFITVAE